nr:glycosyltransferase [Acidimicrobiia bacterium]
MASPTPKSKRTCSVSSPPRVVLFDAYPHLLGGAQRTLLAVASELVARGEPPTVVLPGDGALATAARARSIPVDVVPLPAVLTRFGRSTTGRHAVAAAAALPIAWARLRAAFLRSGAALVHAADHRGALLAAPAARAARLPVVWHVHSVDVEGRFVERTAGRLVGALVAPSAAALLALGAVP